MNKFEAFTTSQLHVLQDALVREVWRSAGTRKLEDLASATDDQAVRYRAGQRMWEEVTNTLDVRNR